MSKEGSEWVVHSLRNETPMIYLKNASNHSKPPNNGWMYNNNGTFVLDLCCSFPHSPAHHKSVKRSLSHPLAGLLQGTLNILAISHG